MLPLQLWKGCRWIFNVILLTAPTKFAAIGNCWDACTWEIFHHMQFHSGELWLDYLLLVVRIEMAVEEEWIGVFFDKGVALRCGNWKARFIKVSQKPKFDETLSHHCALPQQLLLPSKLCDNLRLRFAECVRWVMSRGIESMRHMFPWYHSVVQ